MHCTHGFNRTGFLIISYMVEKMDCSVEAALMAFAQARPPGIYKEDYIKELFRRYEEDDVDVPPPPEMPDWCFECDDSDYHSESSTNSNNHQSRKRTSEAAATSVSSANETENDEDDENAVYTDTQSDTGGESSTSAEPTKKKRRKEFQNLNASFMAGVPGVNLVTDQPRLGNIQDKIQEMCEWKKNGFPGCQPVSMDRSNIKFLHTKPYRVSWKADGTRYMMLILKEGEIFFADRDNAIFEVKGLQFPYRRDLKRHLTDTLVDGVSLWCFGHFFYIFLKFFSFLVGNGVGQGEWTNDTKIFNLRYYKI